MNSNPSLASPLLDSEHILDESVESIICLNLAGEITLWNHGAELLYGYSAEEAVGRHFSMLYPDGQNSAEETVRHIAPQVLSAKRHEIDGWRVRKSGGLVYIHLSAAPLYDLKGEQIGYTDYSIDITRRKQLEETLAERDEQLRQQHTLYDTLLKTQSLAGIGHFILDNDKIIYSNPAASQVTGYSAEELRDLPNFMLLVHPDDHERLLRKRIEAQENRTSADRYDISILTKDGERRMTEIAAAGLPHGDAQQILVVMVDITERKHAENRLQFLALHDSLTGLCNRTLLFDRLNSTIAAARRSKNAFALFYLDLDDFKPINDELGHDAGDATLKTIAQRLRASVRESDTVARVGGDEFILVIRDVPDRQTAESVAAKVIKSLSEPLMVANQARMVGTSLGISMYPEHGTNADLLVQHADAAMYSAKRLGKNRCVFWQG